MRARETVKKARKEKKSVRGVWIKEDGFCDRGRGEEQDKGSRNEEQETD
jgi:hypothetical protein